MLSLTVSDIAFLRIACEQGYVCGKQPSDFCALAVLALYGYLITDDVRTHAMGRFYELRYTPTQLARYTVASMPVNGGVL